MQSQSQSQTTSSHENHVAEQPATRPGWTLMPLEHLPLPTYWPAGLAFGITLIFWSFITSWVILVAGLIVFVASLFGWIQDIRHERKHTTHDQH